MPVIADASDPHLNPRHPEHCHEKESQDFWLPVFFFPDPAVAGEKESLVSIRMTWESGDDRRVGSLGVTHCLIPGSQSLPVSGVSDVFPRVFLKSFSNSRHPLATHAASR